MIVPGPDWADCLSAPMLAALGASERAVLDAVVVAADRLRAMQRRIVDDPDAASLKADGTLVTAADLGSENIIVAAVEQFAVDHAVRLVAEERAYLADEPTDAGETWFIDPLDGTRHYARGGDDYAILVSRWRSGAPDFSVAHYPASDEWLVAVDGMVAVRSADPQTHRPGWRVCYLDSDATDRFALSLRDVDVVSDEESTRALLDLVAGRVHAVAVQVHALKSWDVAPFLHAAAAAGLRIGDEHGRPIALEGSLLDVRYVLAARAARDLDRLVRVVTGT